MKSSESSVGIATGWTAGVRFPTGETDHSHLYSFDTGSGPHPASYQMRILGHFPRGKAAAAWADHSTPSMTVDLLNSMFNFSYCLTSFIVCILGYCCICCIFFVFVVVNLLCIHCFRVSFTVVFFVYCVLIECVVTSCNVYYMSVVSLLYYCHRAKTQMQSNK
jgi:hypothetical protein